MSKQSDLINGTFTDSIDVTGTVVADGLTMGSSSVSAGTGLFQQIETAGNNMYVGIGSNNSAYVQANGEFRIATGGYQDKVTVTTSGNVGIGTSSPSAKLHIGVETEPNITNQTLFIQGSKTGYAGIPGLPLGQLFIYDDTASTVNSGGAIGFGANTGSSQRTWIASINSQRDSATTDGTNYGGSLNFYTRPPQSTPLNRMTIDSSGRVTMPYQPCFSAYMNTQNITNTASFPTVQGVEFNIGGHYNSANGRFTAPINGSYLFTATVQLNNGAKNNPHTNFFKNGAVWYSGWLDFDGASASSQSRILYLAAGDYVNLVLYSSVTTQISGDRTRITGHLIG